MSFLKQLIICSQFLVAVQANNNKILKSDREKVIEVVERSYVNGAFNKLDTDAMKKGFHQEFAIFTPDGEEIKKYPIKKWINNTCLLYTSPSPRDRQKSRMPSSA